MSSKTKKHLVWIPTLFVALFMTSGAIMKLIHEPGLVALFAKVGLQEKLPLFAVAELLFLSLFLWPRTMRIGFYLLTGYYGGAMAVEISIGMAGIFPAMILILIWVAAGLRDRSLFTTILTTRRAIN